MMQYDVSEVLSFVKESHLFILYYIILYIIFFYKFFAYDFIII